MEFYKPFVPEMKLENFVKKIVEEQASFLCSNLKKEMSMSLKRISLYRINITSV